MKRFAALLALPFFAHAQSGPSYDSSPAVISLVSATGSNPYSAMTTTGSSGQAFDYSPTVLMLGLNANGKYYVCGTANPCSGAGGSGTGVTFDQIGSGTNLGHGLVVGAGSVLTSATGGHINADETGGVAFGTAATQNTGTSGTVVPLLSTANTWAQAQAFANTTSVNSVSSAVSSGTNIKAGENATTSATAALSINVQVNTVQLVSAATYSFTLASGTSAQDMTLNFCQPATGTAATVTPPTNVHGMGTVGTTLGKCSVQHFRYVPSLTAWYADALIVINI